MTKTDTRQVLEEAFNVRRAIEAIPIDYTFVEIDGREYEMVEKYELSQFRNELASVMEQALAIAQAALRTGQLVPVQQPSIDVAKANLECLEMSERLQDAEDEIRLLTKALHDAINAPRGVVPASAEAFYDPAAITTYEALRAKDTRP